MEEQWKRGSGAGGFAATNASVAALVIVIDEVLTHLVGRGELRPAGMTKEQIHEALVPYLGLIGRYLQKLDQATISRMRSFGGGGAKMRIAREYQNAIWAEHETFEPEGFPQWKKESTLLFNKEVKPLCERLNQRLSGYVRREMQRVYGEMRWVEELPDEVAKKESPETGVGRDGPSSMPPQPEKPPRSRALLRPVTPARQAHAPTAPRASGVKSSTAGTPPSRPGRKAHNCSLSGGTAGVSSEGPERSAGTRVAR